MNQTTHPHVSSGRRQPVWRRWFRSAEDELHHLRELEAEGNSPATPAISIGRVLAVVVPAFAVMVGLAFLAYYVIA
jgi:hypothetical protein